MMSRSPSRCNLGCRPKLHRLIRAATCGTHDNTHASANSRGRNDFGLRADAADACVLLRHYESRSSPPQPSFVVFIFGSQPAENATMRMPLRASAGQRLRPERLCRVVLLIMLFADGGGQNEPCELQSAAVGRRRTARLKEPQYFHLFLTLRRRARPFSEIVPAAGSAGACELLRFFEPHSSPTPPPNRRMRQKRPSEHRNGLACLHVALRGGAIVKSLTVNL